MQGLFSSELTSLTLCVKVTSSARVIRPGNKTNMCLNKLLSYDGKIYRWHGSLKELKSFVEQSLKLYGSWTSPGGEAKVFRY